MFFYILLVRSFAEYFFVEETQTSDMSESIISR